MNGKCEIHRNQT